MKLLFKKVLFLVFLLTSGLSAGLFDGWSNRPAQFTKEDLSKMQEASAILTKSLRGQVAMGMDFLGGVEDLQSKILSVQDDPDVKKANRGITWLSYAGSGFTWPSNVPSGVSLKKTEKVLVEWTPGYYAMYIKGRCEELVGPESVYRPLFTASKQFPTLEQLVTTLTSLVGKAERDRTLSANAQVALAEAKKLVSQYRFTKNLQDEGMKGMSSLLNFFKKAFKIKGVTIAA